MEEKLISISKDANDKMETNQKIMEENSKKMNNEAELKNKEI